MVGGLSACGIRFRFISDNTKGWLMNFDLNLFNSGQEIRVVEQSWILGQHSNNCVDGRRRLLLVKSKFEVHVHYYEIVSASGQVQVKRRGVALSWLEVPKNGRFIPEDVLRPIKPAQSSMNALHSDFS